MFNERIFHANFFARGGLDFTGSIKWSISPHFHWGAPGIGKTEMATMLGKKFDCDFVHPLVLSNESPATVGGAMFPHESRKYFERIPAKWVHEANEAKRALIIFDEFGDAPALMQAIAQKILNERRVGDTALKGHVRMVCFGNPPEMSTNPQPTGMATANRGAHHELEYGLEAQNSWRRWMMEDGGEIFMPDKIDADAEEKRVAGRFVEDYAHAKGIVLTFVEKKKKLLVIPPEGSKERQRAWTSPRTMTFMTRWLAACRAHNLSEIDRDAGIKAYLGKGMTKEFVEWRHRLDLLDAVDVLDGKIQFEHDPSRPDITQHVLTSGAAVVRQLKENRKDRLTVLYAIMRKVSEKEPDLVYTAAETARAVPFKNNDRRWVMQNLFDADEIIRSA